MFDHMYSAEHLKHRDHPQSEPNAWTILGFIWGMAAGGGLVYWALKVTVKAVTQ